MDFWYKVDSIHERLVRDFQKNEKIILTHGFAISHVLFFMGKLQVNTSS